MKIEQLIFWTAVFILLVVLFHFEMLNGAIVAGAIIAYGLVLIVMVHVIMRDRQ